MVKQFFDGPNFRARLYRSEFEQKIGIKMAQRATCYTGVNKKLYDLLVYMKETEKETNNSLHEVMDSVDLMIDSVELLEKYIDRFDPDYERAVNKQIAEKRKLKLVSSSS